jgi:hypothetical protein
MIADEKSEESNLVFFNKPCKLQCSAKEQLSEDNGRTRRGIDQESTGKDENAQHSDRLIDAARS